MYVMTANVIDKCLLFTISCLKCITYIFQCQLLFNGRAQGLSFIKMICNNNTLDIQKYHTFLLE